MSRKVKQGTVVSDKMKKTVVVRVVRVFRHPRYQKVMRTAEKFKAQAEEGQCQLGDTVEIMETRPLSKEKRWRVVRVIK